MNLLSLLGGQRRKVNRLAAHEFSEALLADFAHFIEQAEPHELYQVNPRYLAERLNCDELMILSLLVAAVAEGLFLLGWQVRCPACANPGEAVSSLAEIYNDQRCTYCGNEYLAHLDIEIFIHFTLDEKVRRLSPHQRDDPAFRMEIDQRLGAVPALSLINTPSFRQLIKDQTLPEGQSLGVKQLSVFFSDLRQSTAFYHKFGDVQAYHWVSQHFQVMFDAVMGHGGTAVKTIGDGVMGVFTNPKDALLGIADGIDGINRLNKRAGFTGDDRLTLKVGLHVGPCIVVTLNGRLDYFGETVNIAARLGGLSVGGDVILSQSLLDDEATCDQAHELGELLPIAARLRGLPGHYDLVRLMLESDEES